MGMSISARLVYGVPITDDDIEVLKRRFQVGDDDDDDMESWQDGVRELLEEKYPTLELTAHGDAYNGYQSYILAVEATNLAADVGDAVKISARKLSTPIGASDLMSCMGALNLERLTVGEFAGSWWMVCDIF